jgi:hypothetical protein
MTVIERAVKTQLQPFEVGIKFANLQWCSLSSNFLGLRGISVFPKPKKPRVLYIGVDEGKSRMKSFASHLNKELKKCKFTKPLLVEVCDVLLFAFHLIYLGLFYPASHFRSME